MSLLRKEWPTLLEGTISVHPSYAALELGVSLQRYLRDVFELFEFARKTGARPSFFNASRAEVVAGSVIADRLLHLIGDSGAKPPRLETLGEILSKKYALPNWEAAEFTVQADALRRGTFDFIGFKLKTSHKTLTLLAGILLSEQIVEHAPGAIEGATKLIAMVSNAMEHGVVYPQPWQPEVNGLIGEVRLDLHGDPHRLAADIDIAIRRRREDEEDAADPLKRPRPTV